MLQALGQGRALDELHDESTDAVALLEPEDRGDVRMMELGEELRLAFESREAFLVLVKAAGRTLIATSRFSFVSVAR